MKKQILQYIKIGILGLVVGLGVMYMSAWTGPSTAAPGGNVAGPVNVGPNAQTKSGDLTVDNLVTVKSVVSSWNSLFAQKLYVGSSTIPSGNTGTLAVNGTISASSLAEGDARTGNTERTVCADSDGILKICGAGGCGTANGSLFTAQPSTGLCSQGSTPSPVGGNGGPQTPSWNWTCSSNSGGGQVANCSANMKIDIDFTKINVFSVPINGCGYSSQFVPTATGGYGNKTYSWNVSTANGTIQSQNQLGAGSISPNALMLNHCIGTYDVTLTVEDSATPKHVYTKTKTFTW